jgi:hypothetical protein
MILRLTSPTNASLRLRPNLGWMDSRLRDEVQSPCHKIETWVEPSQGDRPAGRSCLFRGFVQLKLIKMGLVFQNDYIQY